MPFRGSKRSPDGPKTALTISYYNEYYHPRYHYHYHYHYYHYHYYYYCYYYYYYYYFYYYSQNGELSRIRSD